ncbi:MAG: hypothetical protein IPL84_13380 [Chitinophagaceae bacterium]|nr:hypothetical protein [Chitinophagaceae bacterium]
MKAFSLLVVAVFSLGTVGFGQYQTQQKVTGKAVIKTPTILCEKCQERLNFSLAIRRSNFNKS